MESLSSPPLFPAQIPAASADRPTYSLEESLGYLARRVSLQIGRRLCQNFRTAGYDINLDQWMVLVNLYHHDGQNQQQIGEFCSRDRASITRIIDVLEQQEWVVRETDRRDRRNNLIYMTEAGRQLTRELIKIASQTLSEAYAGVEEQCIEICKRTLRTIYHNLSDRETCGPRE